MSKEPKRNVYVGHRYVPKVMGEWDKTESYEGLCIVTNEGTSYTSKKRVPKGIDILNEEYWVVTGNYNAQIEEYRKDVRELKKDMNDLETGVDSEIERLDQKDENLTTQLAQIMWNVKDFGAKGDGLTDDTEAIQKTLDLAFKENEYNFPIVYLPPGTYLISKPLESVRSGEYVEIRGSGIRSTRILAIEEMNSMLNVGNEDGVHARKTISNITFDGGYLANNAIDASHLRYSTIKDNEIIKIKKDGWALKTSNWVMRVINNNINGQDNSSSDTPYSNGILVTNNTVNNMIIENNVITSCIGGLKILPSSNDLHVIKNTFDNCKDYAILCALGSRSLVIENNYIEACGLNGYVNVETSEGIFEKFEGAIIVHGDYKVLYTYTYKNLIIEKNQFANNNPNTIISLSQVSSASIKNNSVHERYKYKSFVTFRWIGSYYRSSDNILIEIPNNDEQFIVPVNFDTINSRTNQSYITIVDKNKKESNQFNITNLENFEKQLIFDIEKKNDGLGGNLYEIKDSTGLAELEIDLIKNDFLIESNLKLSVLSKGINEENSLQLTVLIDDVEIGKYFRPSLDFKDTFYNSTIQIPKNAKKIKFSVRPLYREHPVVFKNFSIKVNC